jgi:hypothetical protein
MTGSRTLDDIETVNTDVREISRDVRDFRRDVQIATNDQNQKIHAVELEVKGASGKLDLIFLAQTDHETRIRSVERSTLKFAVYAAIIGAALSIAATQVFKYVLETKVAPSLAEKYLDDGRKKSQELREDNQQWRDRAHQEGPK